MPDVYKSRFNGMFVATLTPFDGVGAVDTRTLCAHVDHLVATGVAGVCPAGTTGEFLYLSDEEKREVIGATVQAVDGRVPVIAGVWHLSADGTADLARFAKRAGADAVFLPPPIYYPVADEVIYAWYAHVREACDLPIFAYNIPAYAVNCLTLPCIERLVTQDVIAGIKDSTGKSDRMVELVTNFGARIDVMAASDSFATEGRRIGANGFISAIANIWPEWFLRLWNGDASVQPIVDMVRNCVKANGGIAALKYLATLSGYTYGPSRIPFTALTPIQKRELEQVYERVTQARS